jgi:hypothetical protein
MALLPGCASLTLDNYRFLLSQPLVYTYLRNSLVVTVVAYRDGSVSRSDNPYQKLSPTA